MNTQQLTPNCKDIAEINKNQGIPHGWKQVRFKDCIEIANGQVDPKIEPYCNMKHVGLENIEKFTGRLLFAKLARDENLTSGKYLFNEGDVLYGKIRPELSKVYLAEFEGICSADIYPLKPKKDIIAKFLKYILLDHRFFRYAVSVSARTGLPKINRDDLGGFKIHVPPIREQQKIADILSTWDKAIELKEKLIEQKKEQKKGLMQRLLTGRVRFPEFKGEWKIKKIGDILVESFEVSDKPDINKRITVRLNLKGVEKREPSAVEIEGATTHYIRRKGQFIYGKQNIHKGAFGIIPDYLDGFQSSIDLPSFDFKDGIDRYWFYYYFAREHFYKNLEKIASGTGSKRVQPKDLFKIKIKVPPLEEQRKISAFIQLVDKEIDLLEQELDALKQQKKGLMQLLLTGKVRVKC